MPYDSPAEAVALAARGEGSLAALRLCDDPAEGARLAAALAPFHGRVLAVDPAVGKGHSGHAIVMPQCVHGGPGRAGGGEELGGLRGLRFWMQRTRCRVRPPCWRHWPKPRPKPLSEPIAIVCSFVYLCLPRHKNTVISEDKQMTHPITRRALSLGLASAAALPLTAGFRSPRRWS